MTNFTNTFIVRSGKVEIYLNELPLNKGVKTTSDMSIKVDTVDIGNIDDSLNTIELAKSGKLNSRTKQINTAGGGYSGLRILVENGTAELSLSVSLNGLFINKKIDANFYISTLESARAFFTPAP